MSVSAPPLIDFFSLLCYNFGVYYEEAQGVHIMPKITFGELMRELLFPLLLYGLFTFMMLEHAVQAFRILRLYRREGVLVPARVTNFSVQTVQYGHLRQTQYIVTIECMVPRTGEEQQFVLKTESNHGKKYADLKETEVMFISREEPFPMLQENLRTWKRLRVTTLFGGIFCLLFCLLLVFAIIVYSTGIL